MNIIIIKLIDECCLTASPEIVWKIVEINVDIPAVDDESPELLLNHFGGHTRRRGGAVPSTHCLSRNPAKSKSNSDTEPTQRRHEKMLLHQFPKLLLKLLLRILKNPKLLLSLPFTYREKWNTSSIVRYQL